MQARLKLKREHDAVVGERDALGTQVRAQPAGQAWHQIRGCGRCRALRT